MLRLFAGASTAFVLLTASTAHALQAPPTWRWVTDAPARLVNTLDVPDGAFLFRPMPPGWHVTMGPGGVLFDPRYIAEGRFSVETEIFLFPGTTQQEYGLFLGGNGLEDAASRYVAFVVRRDGSAAVIEHRGETERLLAPWIRHEAVLSHPGGEGPVRNVLKVTADGKDIVFRANGLELVTLPRELLSPDGQFGFRIGRGINVHASRLDLLHRLAPLPARP